MVIYKYTGISNYLDASLINHELYFNNPQNFNDPFDCNFILDTDCSVIEKTNYIRENMARQGFLQDKIDDIVTKALNDYEFWGQMIKKGKDKFLNQIGVSCFSKTNENPLLWAHYSEKHKGICLVFETTLDREFFDRTYDVKYRSNYPKINFIRDRARFDELVLTKSIDWIYEQEVRVMKDTGSKTYSFDPSALIGIIFGCKTAIAEVIRIKDLLVANGYNIFTKKATLRQGSFGFDFENI
jgi:hypothetical protein